MADYETYGDVKLGENVNIEKYVVIYGPVIIGDNTYIGRGAIIGHPAFGNLQKIIKENKKIIEGGSETKIGNDVYIASGVIIYEGVIIENNVKIFHRATIREETKIGENCIIGTNVVIDGPHIEIGKNNLIHAGAYICSKTKIGNQVFIGPQAGTVNEKTAQSRISLPSIEGYRDKEEGPVIEDGASIGEGAHIMMGVKIGKKAVLGAGALATKDIPKNEVWVGIPAKFLKKREF